MTKGALTGVFAPRSAIGSDVDELVGMLLKLTSGLFALAELVSVVVVWRLWRGTWLTNFLNMNSSLGDA